MFDRVSEAAEKMATTASRREFMGRLGRGAAVLAGVLGGLCAAPRLAQGHPHKGAACCWGGDLQPIGGCSQPYSYCVLVSADCDSCVWDCKGVLVSSPCIVV